jgi:hypothetical protein
MWMTGKCKNQKNSPLRRERIKLSLQVNIGRNAGMNAIVVIEDNKIDPFGQQATVTCIGLTSTRP